MAGRGIGCLEVIGLLLAQRGGTQQAEHAVNPIERRAQLVAHIGQEAAFAPAGAFGLDLRFPKVIGQLLRFGLGPHPPLVLQGKHSQRHRQQQHDQGADHQYAHIALQPLVALQGRLARPPGRSLAGDVDDLGRQAVGQLAQAL